MWERSTATWSERVGEEPSGGKVGEQESEDCPNKSCEVVRETGVDSLREQRRHRRG